jgi:hypothetical protein
LWVTKKALYRKATPLRLFATGDLGHWTSASMNMGGFMLIRNFTFKSLIVIFGLLLAANPGFTQDETVETAQRLMLWQLEALKDGDFQRFIEHGNKAFKAFMDQYSFDTFKLQNQGKIAKGYTLEYLGTIRRIGMREHLWKIHISGDKYQLLGSLSVSHGKVVGFNLD